MTARPRTNGAPMGARLRRALATDRARWSAMVLVALGVLLALGWWAGDQRAAAKDADLRASLTQRAVEIARIANPDLVRRLGFVAADRDAPAHLLIREQLTNAAAAGSFRGVWSIAQHDGKLLFGPETYPVDDPLASVPGSTYEEPPPEAAGVFSTRRSVAVGPYTDEYGTFVTAFAPVLDPSDGTVLLVVGVDVLAADWRAQVDVARVSPMLVALGAFLFLLGAASVVRWRNRRRSAADMTLRAWIILPVALALLGGVAVSFARQSMAAAEQARHEAAQLENDVAARWSRLVADEAQVLGALTEGLAADPVLASAWAGRDAAALRAAAGPVLDDLESRFGVTDLTFVESDRTVFLEVNRPASASAVLDHFTLLEASRTGLDASGLDLGADGSLTLHFVRPSVTDGVVTGYVELGVESSHLLTLLAGDLGADVALVVRKSETTQEAFVAGMGIIGYTGRWSAYPAYVIEHQTIAVLPPEVAAWLATADDSMRGGAAFTSTMGRRMMDTVFVSLPDEAGRDAAGVIVLRDATVLAAATFDSQLLTGSMLLAALTAVLALLWSVTGRAERQLAGAFAGLRGSEEHLREAQRVGRTGSWTWDAGTGALVWSAEMYRVFGREAAAGPLNLGRLPEFLAPESVEAVRQAFAAALADGAPFMLEVEFARPDGGRGWVLLRGVAAGAADGSATGLHGTVTDISERKLAEDSLRSTGERLALATRAGGVGIWEYDIVTGALAWDDQEFRLYGIARDQFSGAYEAWQAGLHPDDRAKGDDEVRLALAGKREYSTEFRVIWPDGSIHHIREIALVQRDDQGRPVRMVGTSWDITADKRAREEVRASEENFRSFVESTADMLVVLASSGRIVFANSAVTRILGYAAEDIAAMRMVDFFPEDHRLEATEALEALLRGDADSATLTLASAHGALIPAEASAWKGSWNGKPSTFVVSRDMTAQNATRRLFELLFRRNPAMMVLSDLADDR
ncbi:MAG: PAS domain-containing protein, partial [Chloroflexota bacterium]